MLSRPLFPKHAGAAGTTPQAQLFTHAPDVARPLILAGTSSMALAEEVCQALDLPLGKVEVKRFSDGETFVKINENARGREAFIVASTCKPVNESLMELMLIIDALRRASAFQICAVIPYFGYARQDRKDQGRVALSAKLVANLIVTSGANRVVTVDLHAGQIQGFFDIPVDHLEPTPIMVESVRRNFDLTDSVVVAPDLGSVKRTRSYGERLGLPLAIIDKRRPKANESEVMTIIGDVNGKQVFIFDDIIDTAGTLCNAASAIVERGARRVIACCTHAVLSGPAIDRLREAPIDTVIVTNTIPPHHEGLEKIQVISVAPLLAESIKRIFLRQSLSSLFDATTTTVKPFPTADVALLSADLSSRPEGGDLDHDREPEPDTHREADARATLSPLFSRGS